MRAAAAAFGIATALLATPADAETVEESLFETLTELTAVGPHPAGSAGEAANMDWLAGQAELAGWATSRQHFPVDTRPDSQNLLLRAPDATAPPTVLLGGHVDSVDAGPGANDNGSGVAVLLEVARRLADLPGGPPPHIAIVFFGAEERACCDFDHHHYGSRHYAATMTAADVAALEAMVSVDMVGRGPTFLIVHTGEAGKEAIDTLTPLLAAAGVPPTYSVRGEISDHEPFEKLGVPSAFLWRPDDDCYHSACDTADHVELFRLVPLIDPLLDFALRFDPAPGAFSDDERSYAETDIDTLAAAGITAGCGTDPYGHVLYCPTATITREQMAAFLVEAAGLPPASASPFSDIAGSFAEADIRALAAAGVTFGCAPGLFCPGDPVTRAEMAVFLTRAFELPPAGTPPFSDALASFARDAIASVAAAGVTAGCAVDRYCPNDPVTREQMAVFLVRATVT